MTIRLPWHRHTYLNEWSLGGAYRTRYAAMRAYRHVEWQFVPDDTMEIDGKTPDAEFRLVRETLND